MRWFLSVCCLFGFAVGAHAQSSAILSNLTRPHDYVLKRISSWDRTGGNHDYRSIPPSGTLTLLNRRGPGEITCENQRPRPDTDGKFSTTATFSAPGEYVVRVQANDRSGDGGGIGCGQLRGEPDCASA